MIPHTQLIVADSTRSDGRGPSGEAGDCLRAVVASILDVEHITTVPNFADAGDNYRWWVALREWARSRGGDFISVVPEFPVLFDGDHIPFAIGSGPSPRGPWPHSVAVDVVTGQMVWDPHPSRAGLAGPISALDCYVAPYSPEPEEQVADWLAGA